MAMARVRYTIVTVPAPSLEEAHETIGRMMGLGFARNRMNVTRRADGTVHVAVNTPETERTRVLEALNRGGTGLPAGLSTTSAATLMLILGGAAALGAGLWALRSANALPRFPRRERGGGSDQLRLLGEENEAGEDGLGSGRFTSREQSQSNIGAHPGGYTGAASRAGQPGRTSANGEETGSQAQARPASGPSQNTGFSSANPPQAPSGLSSPLQPGGTFPGGGPGASVASLGTGGAQTGGSDTGSPKRMGR